MNRRSFVMTGVASLVLGPAAVRAQGLVICRQCGREAKPGETVCSHCGTALPKPHTEEKKTESHPPADDKNAAVVQLAKSVTENSLRQARELEDTQTAVALCYFQNALAVMRLLPVGTLNAKFGDAVIEGNNRTMQALVRGRVPCRKCKGTGKFQLDLGKLDRSGKVKSVDGVACPACKGAGSFQGYRDVGKAKMAVLQGRSEFERRQMVAGDVKLGRALVPAKLEALLTNRQRALVMTGMSAPCPSCQQTGRQVCTTCKGTGWVKCDYEGCENGEIKETHKSKSRQSKRMNDELTKKCPQCEGLGEVSCKVCKGNGSVECKHCDGGGLAPRCSRCTGTGLMTCTKCKGTGEVKGSLCPDCKGETVILCTTCRGEGAVAR